MLKIPFRAWTKSCTWWCSLMFIKHQGFGGQELELTSVRLSINGNKDCSFNKAWCKDGGRKMELAAAGFDLSLILYLRLKKECKSCLGVEKLGICCSIISSNPHCPFRISSNRRVNTYCSWRETSWWWILKMRDFYRNSKSGILVVS